MTLGARPQPQESTVQIRFPVYIGAVVYVTEILPEFYVPTANARRAVNALAIFSLKYGMLTALFPYVLLMILVNYVVNAPKLVSRT